MPAVPSADFSRPITVDNVQTPDAWLRGYFTVNTADRRATAIEITGVQRNVDFLRLRDVALHLLNPRPGMRILDVGCANGPTMIYCGLQGAEVYGQDLCDQAVSDANAQLKRFAIPGRACVGDATKLTFESASFDAVISSDFVEHITDAQKVAMFREARRVLKPGGKLVTKTPNLRYLRASLWYKRVRALARGQDPRGFLIANTEGTADPQHIGLTDRRGLSACLDEAGFLNHRFYYAPLRRFGANELVEVLSTEVPVLRDTLCEDLFCVAYKPIVMSHFPD